MSGLRDDLSAVSNEEAYKLVQKNLQESGDARLLIIFITCYAVPDKEYESLLKLIKDKSRVESV